MSRSPPGRAGRTWAVMNSVRPLLVTLSVTIVVPWYFLRAARAAPSAAAPLARRSPHWWRPGQ